MWLLSAKGTSVTEHDLNGRRTPDVLTDEHKDGSLWINHRDEIWAWVQDDWRMLRNSGLWSGIGLYSGEWQMRAAGPFTEVDFAKLT